MKVFVTGGTGFIGREIVRRLIARGDSVVVLTRRPGAARTALADEATLVEGDVQYAGPWQSSLAGCDGVIHLAGESVASRRWDARIKQIISDSRIESTERVVEGLASLDSQDRPRVLISASGADFYPWAEEIDAHTTFLADDPIDESGLPGSSFLARVCRRWESEAAAAEELGIRVVRMRTGLVLGEGGALDRMVTPFKLFVGGRLGSGKQWTSWIHLADAARAYLFALDSEALAGGVNLVAPENVRNRELSAALGRALGRPSWMPVPRLALKLAVGEFADYILHGRNMVPSALLAAGFEFEHATIQSALAAIYG